MKVFRRNIFGLLRIAGLQLLLCMLLFISGARVVWADWYRHDFEVMGTRASVELWADDPLKAEQLAAQVEAEMQRIEARMSPYIENSELSAINRPGQAEARVISEELYRVLETAQSISRASDGVFDISFASVGFLYDYREHVRPGDKQLKDALDAVDYRSIVLEEIAARGDEPAKFQISLLRPQMKIDLGGIAKGYAVDRGIALLREQGVEAALVNAGGDSRLLGDRGKDMQSGETIPWMIGIRHPRDKAQNALRLPLADTAISTSGDYERYFIDGDERVHHIINTRTGHSTLGIASASVIGEQSILCDALATAVFASGVERGLGLIEKFPGYDAIIIDSVGKVHYSSGLAAPGV